MQSDKLVEKLAFQVSSFQEGFEELSRSRDFNEMTKTFAHLLRGNFSLKNVYLLHKIKPDSSWSALGAGNKPEDHLLSYLKDSDRCMIKYHPHDNIIATIFLPLADSTFLGIIIGQKIDGKDFTAVDKITLQILLQIFDSAHKSFLNQLNEKKLIFELNEKVFQLNNLIDTGIELTKLDKSRSIYDLALERVSSITNASSALIRIIPDDKDIQEEYYTFPGNFDPKLILDNKLRIESGFKFNGYNYQFILSEKEIRGGVTSFNDLDKLLLESVTRQLSASIENEFLHLESLEKERIEKELNLAATIQQQIIPKTLPEIKGYELAGINIPSKEVGGDYYDCIKLENGKYIFIIADVAGKGISAALLVNTLNAALYSYLEFNLPLTEMVEKLNKLIFKVSPSDKFITFFIALLEPFTGKLEVVNAGHNPILILRNDGTLDKIDAGGLGLGMLDFGMPYPQESLNINSGDKLFLYTDGIPEAMNENEEEYSDEKMINFLKNHSGKNTKDFISSFIEDIQLFTAGNEQSDDITFLILKRN